MAERIAVNTAALKNDASSISVSVNTLNTISNAVYEDVIDLNSMWEGSAHIAFVFQFIQDKEFVKDTIIWLRNYVEELENAQKEYDKAESNVSSLVQGLK